MNKLEAVAKSLKANLEQYTIEYLMSNGELTIIVKAEDILSVCNKLVNGKDLKFEQLIDLTVVDYLHYGLDEWQTKSATATGFSRGVQDGLSAWEDERFAVVYHFLSISSNVRLRIKVFLTEESPLVDSIVQIYSCANWYEREAYDLFGVLFKGHPDLRRILTDYGFIGHPFRKDFPVSGRVQVRYDAAAQRVIYEPVDIEERTLVPKVIREDNRYLNTETDEEVSE